MTNKDLVESCKKGDNSSKQKIYNLYAGRMMGLCIRYSRNSDEAEDIFQEGFIKVFLNIRKLKNGNVLESWMRRIFVNTAINHYQKERRHYYHSDTDALETFYDESETIIDQINQQELLALIERLPHGCRIVFNLYIMEGYKHEEIAKMLDVSVGTSKSQLSRAKALLRKSLNNLGLKGFVRA